MLICIPGVHPDRAFAATAQPVFKPITYGVCDRVPGGRDRQPVLVLADLLLELGLRPRLGPIARLADDALPGGGPANRDGCDPPFPGRIPVETSIAPRPPLGRALPTRITAHVLPAPAARRIQRWLRRAREWTGPASRCAAARRGSAHR